MWNNQFHRCVRAAQARHRVAANAPSPSDGGLGIMMSSSTPPPVVTKQSTIYHTPTVTALERALPLQPTWHLMLAEPTTHLAISARDLVGGETQENGRLHLQAGMAQKTDTFKGSSHTFARFSGSFRFPYTS